ncbi:MAG: hypothetical protein COW59_05200 [Lysobacterales bacterium CG17_big_fil_post_rev_8_21_14_2_50_64_11]|nr:MAG: hypothetical protein COW59_05200 [Xanthomonadales bacterium CG17_big_fil_post_rev_8_21_14_2_50_64_11]
MNRLQNRLLGLSNLLVLALAFMALVAIGTVGLRGWRVDLTENALYTLSPGTLRIIEKIDEPIHLYFYFSDQAARDLPQLRIYAQRVRELLEEMASRSHGKLRLQVIDPLPFSEAEDRAGSYGLQAVPVGSSGATLFFGLVGTNATDGQTIVPFFQPSKESFLEYDIAKLISSLSTDQRSVVALYSSLPLAPGYDPASGQASDGWVIDNELNQLFELRRLQLPISDIAPDVDALVLVHPKGLSDDSLYAIDQFVLRGGKLLALVDPYSEAAVGAGAGDPSTMFAAQSSDMGKLFTAWGVQFDPGKVVLDSRYALQVQSPGSAQPVRHLGVLGLSAEALNQRDVVSAQIESFNLSTAGALTLSADSTLSLEPLAQSSDAAALTSVDKVRFLPDPANLFEDFKPSGDRYVLAGRLSGSLKTAFPERKAANQIVQGTADGSIIVVADSDLLADRMWVSVQSVLGQRALNPFAGNGDFVINAVDNLVGSSDLIAVRTRAGSSRPFARVEALKRRAEERFRVKESELQAQLIETERRLSALQGQHSEGGSALLSAEQQAELERFQQQKLRIRKELRDVQLGLNRDIEALGMHLKLINILGMPLLVSLFALGFAGLRARRRRAG